MKKIWDRKNMFSFGKSGGLLQKSDSSLWAYWGEKSGFREAMWVQVWFLESDVASQSLCFLMQKKWDYNDPPLRSDVV